MLRALDPRPRNLHSLRSNGSTESLGQGGAQASRKSNTIFKNSEMAQSWKGPEGEAAPMDTLLQIRKLINYTGIKLRVPGQLVPEWCTDLNPSFLV